MTSLETIAQKIGVSVSTVSRALNDKPGVSQAVRQRILASAKELNYKPNSAARGLATALSRTVGFLCADYGYPLGTDPFYDYIMHGAEIELRKQDYYLIVSTISASPSLDAQSFALVQERRVDGLILAGPIMPARFIHGLLATACKVVLVDNQLANTAIDCVVIDDRMGGYLATRHLIEHGYERIVFIGGPSAWPSIESRYVGYLQAIGEADLEPLSSRQAATNVQTGYQAMRQVLAGAGRVRAVFAANDAMAIGGMKAAREAGLHVPDDIAFVGFDNVEHATHSTPPLTTMHVPKRQIGMLAARRLLELFGSEDLLAPVTTAVSPRLVVRRSCGCDTMAHVADTACEGMTINVGEGGSG